MNDDLINDESRTDETLTRLMIGSLERGMEIGFTMGKGRPPRPEDVRALKEKSKLVGEGLMEIFQGASV